MCAYNEFAYYYANGPYPEYSKRMAELLPAVLEHFGAKPEAILDIACGEGTFAVEMAKKGYFVVGIDKSLSMLELAREKAKREQVSVDFRLRDMAHMTFEESFDLATCWFDSLNYLWALSELERTFKGVYRALRPGGLFIFDISTIYGLSAARQKEKCILEVDRPDMLVIHRPSYNYELNMATTNITGFRKEGDHWVRMDELHAQKGFYLYEIRDALRAAGLRELARWGDFKEMTPAENDSPRIWYVVQKPVEETPAA